MSIRLILVYLAIMVLVLETGCGGGEASRSDVPSSSASVEQATIAVRAVSPTPLVINETPSLSNEPFGEARPAKAMAHFKAGEEFLEEGILEGAIQEYDEAIRLDPQDAMAYNNRGVS